MTIFIGRLTRIPTSGLLKIAESRIRKQSAQLCRTLNLTLLLRATVAVAGTAVEVRVAWSDQYRIERHEIFCDR